MDGNGDQQTHSTLLFVGRPMGDSRTRAGERQPRAFALQGFARIFRLFCPATGPQQPRIFIVKPATPLTTPLISPPSILRKLLAATALSVVVQLAGCASKTDPPTGRTAAIDSYVQGVLAYNHGDSDQAMKDLQEALQQHPNLVMAHDLLGDIYQIKQNYKSALAQFRATSKLDPYSYKNFYKQGLVLQLLNRAKDAIVVYLKALQLKPDDALTTQNIGVAYLSLNDLDNAIKYCRRAVELDDHSAPAWSNLAVALETAKLYKESEMAYRRALELDSNRLEIADGLAGNLVKQNRLAEAQSVMDQVVRLGESASHRKRYGDVLFLEKKYDEAVLQYTRALKLDSRHYQALNEMGRTLVTQYNDSLGLDEDKRKAALDAWRRSLLLKADQPRIVELMKTYSMKFSDQSR
jgi:tetratricopeptide (TPR) repeat protein